MSSLIHAIGPLAFGVIAFGIAPAVILVTVMKLIGSVSDRFADSKPSEFLSEGS